MLRVFFAQLYLSVADFDFYSRVVWRPLSETLRFLLLLAALVAVFLTLLFAWRWFPEAEHFVAWAEENIPPFEIRDGRLETAVEQPFMASYERAGRVVSFVFDTTGAHPDPSGLREPVFLLAEERLFVRFEGRTDAYSWEDFGSLVFQPGDLADYADVLKLVFFPVGYSFFLIYTLAAKALTALILCPLAYSVGLVNGRRLGVASCFAITLHSLVPAIAIDLAVRMTTVTISYFDLIYLAVAALYTFLATQKTAGSD
jgi:hypothetical protein